MAKNKAPSQDSNRRTTSMLLGQKFHGNFFPQNSAEENLTFKARNAEQLAFILNQTSNENVSTDALHEQHAISLQMSPEDLPGEEAPWPDQELAQQLWVLLLLQC